MSTLNKPNYSMCSIALTYPARSYFQRTMNKERRYHVRMNVATHQEKKKNEKTDKRKAGEERRLANFKEIACYPSAVVQGAARRKNVLCEGSTRGNWDPRKGQRPF